MFTSGFPVDEVMPRPRSENGPGWWSQWPWLSFMDWKRLGCCGGGVGVVFFFFFPVFFSFEGFLEFFSWFWELKPIKDYGFDHFSFYQDGVLDTPF